MSEKHEENRSNALDKMGFKLAPTGNTESKYGVLRFVSPSHSMRKPFFFKIKGDDEWRAIL